MTSRRQLSERIARTLAARYGGQEARQIARLLLEELAGITLTQLALEPDAPASLPDEERITAELAAGRPLQYVVGRTEFCGLRIAVREGVLIPRPETEELVDRIAAARPDARRILDIGTGSGCIALALRHRLPQAAVTAVDISPEALAVARENAAALGLEVDFREADALAGVELSVDGRFDLIVSNPPYVPLGDLPRMRENVTRYEPHLALFVPDDDPLRFYRAIARSARGLLHAGGQLWFEIYEDHGDALRRMLAGEGFPETELYRDINDKPRMLCCRR